MEEEGSSSIDSILEFLRKNRFMRAEAALISELSNNKNSTSNGVFDKKKQVSDEFVVKEIQCGGAASAAATEKSHHHHHHTMNDVSVQTTQSPSAAAAAAAANNSSFWEDRFTFSDSLVDTELDLLPPWNHTDSEVYSIDPTTTIRSFVNPSSHHEKVNKSNKVAVEEDIFSHYDHGKASQSLGVDSIQEGFITTTSSDQWKDCSVATVYPLSKGGSTSAKDIGVPVLDKRQGKKKVAAASEQEDDLETALYLGKSRSGYDEVKNLSGFAFSLPHVRIKSEDKSMNYTSEERDVLDEKLISTENGFLIGSYLDVPIGQEIHSSG